MPHRRLLPIILTLLTVALLLPLGGGVTAAAAAGSRAAPAGAPLPARFEPPPEWSSICDSVGRRGTRYIRGTNCRYLKLDGVFRRWVVDVPRSSAFPMDRAWPVVMVVHGSSASGERMREKTNWPAVAGRVGAIGVYPTAWRYRRLSNNLRVTRWNTYTLRSEIDLDERLDGYPEWAPFPARDMEFLRRLMTDLRSFLRLDQRHIHAAGSSQGGRFLSRLAVEMSDTFASMSCLGWCDAPPRRIAVPRRMSILYGIGTRDDHVVRFLRRTHPALSTVPTTWPEAWTVLRSILRPHLRAWTLPLEPATVKPTSLGLNVQWRALNRDPRWVTRFRVMILEDMGHAYPAPWVYGGVLDFAEIAWDFYRDNPMPGAAS